MSSYQVLSIESAPEGSKEALSQLQSAFGFIPNVAGAVANSPTLIKSLASVFASVHSGTFTEAEIQVLLLTNAVTNRSLWPIAFHSSLALELGVDASDVDRIRDGSPPIDPRVVALSSYAKGLIEGRGHARPQDVRAMENAGFNAEQILSVIAVTAASTITNYGANLTDPPLEERFQRNSWKARS